MTTRKGKWISTFSGNRFWPLDPRPEEIHIEDIAHALSNICRYFGHCHAYYNVAEHSVILASYVPRHLALQALLHDAAEAYVGDMGRPLKDCLPEYVAIEQNIAKMIFEKFRLPWPMNSYIKEIDNRILLDERAKLMVPSGWEWEYTKGLEPLGVTISCWTPREAKREFLRLFSHLVQ